MRTKFKMGVIEFEIEFNDTEIFVWANGILEEVQPYEGGELSLVLQSILRDKLNKAIARMVVS